jgi:hypothetical protein
MSNFSSPELTNSCFPQDAEPRVVKRVRRGRKQAKLANVAVEESTTVASEAKFVEQIESTNRRKPPPLNVQWSDEDKSKESLFSSDGP